MKNHLHIMIRRYEKVTFAVLMLDNAEYYGAAVCADRDMYLPTIGAMIAVDRAMDEMEACFIPVPIDLRMKVFTSVYMSVSGKVYRNDINYFEVCTRIQTVREASMRDVALPVC